MIRSVIVEDEFYAAEHLSLMLQRSGRNTEVVARLDSVKSAVEWLRNNAADLIFLDIQLHNDLGFEIFDHVQISTPVIFTTSYNDYAIQSFEVNNLAYLLKPVEEEFLHAALDKYQWLYNTASSVKEKIIPLQTEYQERFLVQSGKAIKSIPVAEVAYIKVNRNYVVITTKDASQYVLESTLDAVEQRLNGRQFFRINRQFIVNIDAIDCMFVHSRGRLKIETIPSCKEEIIVGIERAPDFKSWLIR